MESPKRVIRKPYHGPSGQRQAAQAANEAAQNACPTCGASGDDPCVTPSGKVKDTWHAKRSS